MNIWSRVYKWSLLIIAALIPSGIYELTLAFVALAGLCWLLQKNYTKLRSLKAEPPFLFATLLYLYVLISAIFSTDHKEALSSLSVYLPLIFFPFFVGLSGNISNKLIRKIEMIFLFSTVFTMLLMLGYALADTMITGVGIVRLNDADYSKFSSFGLTNVFGNFHPTYFSMFVNHGVFITIPLVYENYKQKRKGLFFIYLILFCFLCLSLLLLNSMISVLAFLLILFYYCIVLLKKMGFSLYKRVMTVTGFVVLAAGFLYFNPLNIYKIETLKTRGLKPTDNYVERNLLTIRMAKWDTHLLIIRRHFLFGTTEGDIKPIRKQAYLEKGYKDLALHNYNAHNQFLEVFANYGLIGFVLFAGMLTTAFFKKRSRNFYLFMLMVLVTWLTESTWERQQGFNYIMFFFALYTAPLVTDLVSTRQSGK